MARHVVIYSDDPDKGGVANYNHQIALGLRGLGWRVSLVQSRTASPTVAAREAAGIGHEWISYDTGAEFIRTITETADAEAACTRLQPDVVLFSDCCPVSNIAAKHVALRRRLPCFFVVHFAAAYLAERFAKCLPVVRQQYAQAAGVAAVSTDNLGLLRRLFGLGADRGQVIFNGVGAAFFRARDRAAGEARRREFRIPADAIVSLTTARLAEVKGHILQLHALELLRQRHPKVRLACVWVGDGELRAQLAAEVAKRQLQDRVFLTGHQADVSGWLDAADIFTLTSMIEGMPLCIMEAMARGLPVAATAISGIPEEMGDTGMLLADPQQDAAGAVTALAGTWQKWAQSTSTRAAVGEAARVRAGNHFRAETMIAQVSGQLARAVEAGTPREVLEQAGQAPQPCPPA